MTQKIVYQGEPGAYSHLACSQYFPDHEPVACSSFAKAFAQVRSGAAQCAMIPVENTVAGRVSDIYHLLPEGGLHIIGERYLPIHHQLLGVAGAKLSDIKTARSHHMALGQVRKFLSKHDIDPVVDVDTAGAARKVVAGGDKSVAAVASKLASETYGLDVLATDIEDAAHNTTRFIDRKFSYEKCVGGIGVFLRKHNAFGHIPNGRNSSVAAVICAMTMGFLYRTYDDAYFI